MKDGGPAFPGVWWDRDSLGETEVRECWIGMTLRDWFAGQALRTLRGWASQYATVIGEEWSWEAVAVDAYRIADAMLAAREKEASGE